MLRARLNPNRFIHDSAVRWSTQGQHAIIKQLRANADGNVKRFGVPWPAVLVDAVVHALDIRQPLGITKRASPEASPSGRLSCWHSWFSFAVLGGSVRRRLAGVCLVADDAGWSKGQGAEVRGRSAVVLLALAGRSVGADELAGPGAPTLLGRLPV